MKIKILCTIMVAIAISGCEPPTSLNAKSEDMHWSEFDAIEWLEQAVNEERTKLALLEKELAQLINQDASKSDIDKVRREIEISNSSLAGYETRISEIIAAPVNAFSDTKEILMPQYVSLDTKEILMSEYMSNANTKSNFIVRIKPNNELVLAQILVVYGNRKDKNYLVEGADISKGIDINIPKNISGSNITEVILAIDESYNNGSTQLFVSGVSMWAPRLLIKVNAKNEHAKHVINYKTGEIGWHGSHAFLYCEDQSKSINKFVTASINGITSIDFNRGDICKENI